MIIDSINVTERNGFINLYFSKYKNSRERILKLYNIYYILALSSAHLLLFSLVLRGARGLSESFQLKTLSL